MSTQSTRSTEQKERILRRYLHERGRDGDFYCKSKFITDDIDLSTKEIGAMMSRLREESDEFDIEKWGYTGGTTWHIIPNDDVR